MLFIIHGFDKKGDTKTRLDQYEAHKAFLADLTPYGVKMVMSGPLTSDDEKTMIGSFMLVEAPDRQHVEAFNKADPFNQAGVWEHLTITAFLKRQG
jgi:uncharacterized protein